MDRAQLPFQAAGLDVPSYVTNGNHDGLVQGNQDGQRRLRGHRHGLLQGARHDDVATPGLDPTVLLSPSSAFMLVPPDPLRRFVDKRQIKADLRGQRRRATRTATGSWTRTRTPTRTSRRSYYAWDPPEAPGFRFISIDTLSEGGIVEQSSNGNIDDPQFQWLERELQFASADDKLIVVFGHHPVRSLNSNVAGRGGRARAPASTTRTATCPSTTRTPAATSTRASRSRSTSASPASARPAPPTRRCRELLTRFPHVIAYVAGHTHENRIQPFTRAGGGVWWGIETSATADWPVQHRTIEVMDNLDGTLSIFGTVLDAASDSQAPAPGVGARRSTRRCWPRSAASSPTTTRRRARAPARARPRTRTSSCWSRTRARANLELIKSDSPDPVPLGEDLTYTLSIANHGPSDASAVTVTDTLPASVEFLSATPSQGSCLHAGGIGVVRPRRPGRAGTRHGHHQGGPDDGRARSSTRPASIPPQADDNPADNSDTEQTVVGPGQGYPRPKGATPLRVPAGDRPTTSARPRTASTARRSLRRRARRRRSRRST